MNSSTTTDSEQVVHFESTLSVEKCQIIWMVEDIRDWRTDSSWTLVSPTFPTDRQDISWNIQILPRSEVDPNWCSVMVTLLAAPANYVMIRELAFTMWNSDKTRVFSKKLPSALKVSVGSAVGWRQLVSSNLLLGGIHPDYCLGMECNISTVMRAKSMTTTYLGRSVLPKFDSTYVQDFASLVDSKEFGDISIVCGGRNFRAYKGILAARSPIFAAMFRNNMDETNSSRVNIEDIEPNVFGEFLRFIHTDHVQNIQSIAHILYCVADKYDVPSLRQLCVACMSEHLSVHNAAMILQVADLYDIVLLKQRVMQFLCCKDASGVTETEGWIEMTEKNPRLAMEAYEVVAHKLSTV